ncbi:hypothetical protein M422DRAFT_35964 [Sphaerobolus stellatus SS14]|uniref:Protoporphyrinogen oxidase n=1 Tax=Sphaerobolus stellatus (strain SS14) TaxID=990650 RepID=A0A0C9USG8_SPHS4|nr:hypothetical protein M422DRAFT_35964 [Sphaerobolus stellatus SS14]
MAPSTIAVLGGGITGLSSAFHLSRRYPKTKIVLLEKSNRLGGWIQSKRVKVPIPGGDVGNVVLELGPRTLRTQSHALLELINLLGLQSQIITTPATSPAAQNRFLYIPDSGGSGLTRIPTNPLSLLFSRLAPIILPAVTREAFRKSNRPASSDASTSKEIEDDSIDSILSRRFSPELARVMGSSLIHGIYASDSRKVSVRAAMPIVWKAEGMGGGSIVKGLWKMRGGDSASPTITYETGGLEKLMKGMSVYSFKGGMQALVDALTERLQNTENVEVRLESDVKDVIPKNSGFEVSLPTSNLTASHVVSSLPLNIVHALPSLSSLPNLTTNPHSSVSVVSFIFPFPLDTIHPAGFGYLIPRPKSGYDAPNHSNPEGVLGVVFDSCSVASQDTPHGQTTKMTMMVGGPYGLSGLPPPEDTKLFGKVLFETLKRHLGKELPPPVHIEVNHRWNCIPTLLPGHLGRMEELKDVLAGGQYGGRLEVVGSAVQGVSVGDCVSQGRETGQGWD